MFRGTSSINLDAKGRLAIPVKYRTQLKQQGGGSVVVTADKDQCLLLYGACEWVNVENRINSLPDMDRNARIFKRFFIGNAADCDMDGQGRILLPEHLREFAKLDKRVALVGQVNKFEIWNYQHWVARLDDVLSDGCLDQIDSETPGFSNFSL